MLIDEFHRLSFFDRLQNMFSGGKYVLAPPADDGTDDSERDSICVDDLEVAAHETVEMDGPSWVESEFENGSPRRLGEAGENSGEKHLPETDPNLDTDNVKEKQDLEHSLKASPVERGCNIRWDLIPKFPKEIPSNKLWEYWKNFIENFEIAVSLSTFTGPADRAKLLYLSLGKTLQDIISAANLQPNYRDPRCYATFVTDVNNYFKSMTDPAAEHEALLAMRQAKGESIVTFHANLTKQARLCGYTPNEEVRFVLAQLLKGMQNKELANTARTYGHNASIIVQAATRVEAYEAGQERVEGHAPEVLAVNR